MLTFFKRYRELFAIAALLVLPLVTYLAHAKQGRDLNVFDRAVLFVSTPVQRLVTAVGYGLVGGWNDYLALRRVREENLSLRREALRLREQADRDAEARLENDRLRRALDFAENAPTPLFAAPVIGVSPVRDALSVTLGKGSDDGVQPNMAIATPEGIVGRIRQVQARTSQAILVGDPKLRIPVRIQRSRARATVRGRGELLPLELLHALRTDDIEDGDVAVTAGTDGVFPKGLVVGRVRNVVKKNYGIEQQAEVVPAADASRLEEVLVLASPPREAPEARSGP